MDSKIERIWNEARKE